MRKFFNCLLVLAYMTLLLSSCGSDDVQDDPETPQEVTSMTDAKKQ